MISEMVRYQGVAIRELIAASHAPLTIQCADHQGRLDCFRANGGAFQIKYSSKRLSPWQFTLAPEQLGELAGLRATYPTTWLVLVCGIDGVVGLSYEELSELIDTATDIPVSIRVRRSRNTGYRVSGSLADLKRVKPMGLDAFAFELNSGAAEVETST